MKRKVLTALDHCFFHFSLSIGHFIVVYLVAKALIWREAEGNLIDRDQYLASMITK